jgi:hypothetical protein
MVDGKDFRLPDEVRYVQRCAARHDGRIVTIGQLILFSTETGDAWLLDKDDGLAAPLARDGDPQPIHIEETDANFTIEWNGHYRIEGDAFIYALPRSPGFSQLREIKFSVLCRPAQSLHRKNQVVWADGKGPKAGFSRHMSLDRSIHSPVTRSHARSLPSPPWPVLHLRSLQLRSSPPARKIGRTGQVATEPAADMRADEIGILKHDLAERDRRIDELEQRVDDPGLTAAGQRCFGRR